MKSIFYLPSEVSFESGLIKLIIGTILCGISGMCWYFFAMDGSAGFVVSAAMFTLMGPVLMWVGFVSWKICYLTTLLINTDDQTMRASYKSCCCCFSSKNFEWFNFSRIDNHHIKGGYRCVVIYKDNTKITLSDTSGRSEADSFCNDVNSFWKSIQISGKNNNSLLEKKINRPKKGKSSWNYSYNNENSERMKEIEIGSVHTSDIDIVTPLDNNVHTTTKIREKEEIEEDLMVAIRSANVEALKDLIPEAEKNINISRVLISHAQDVLNKPAPSYY